jgi:hypothetical protein
MQLCKGRIHPSGCPRKQETRDTPSGGAGCPALATHFLSRLRRRVLATTLTPERGCSGNLLSRTS